MNKMIQDMTRKMTMIKKTLMMVMMVLGVGTTWGQTDYSGTYYIKSESVNKYPSGDYYLCPTENWAFFHATNIVNNTNNGQPFLTTHIMDNGEEGKYKWIIEKHTVDDHDYYAFKYSIDYVDGESSSSRYLSYNRKITISGTGTDRMRIHLKKIENPTDDELFDITPYSTYWVISPKKVDVDDSNKQKYLVVNGGNTNDFKAYYDKVMEGSGVLEKKNGPSNVLTTGILGTWNNIDDPNAPFSLEEVIDRPTFASTNNTQIVINHSAGENATIYYTTDGSSPTTTNNDGSGTAPLQIDMPANAVTLKAIAVIDNLPSCISSIQVLPNATVSVETSTITYNGSAQEPVVTVKDGETPIPSGEYEVGYSNNVNASDAAVVMVTNASGGNYIVYGSTTFTINKKDLTITANNHTISYGDAPADNGVTCEGFVNSETIAVLEGTLEYAYNYERYGNVGNYTITPSGLTSTNYNITYHTGTLTVNRKEVGLTWSTTTSFPYDGVAHALTAEATGMVNDDAIGVTVTTTAKEGSSLTEGNAINAGSYTATASTLTGGKAGNYTLPAANTQDFTIAKIGITPTVTLDGWTYGETAATPSVTGNSGNGTVTYTYKVKDADDATYSETKPTDAGTYTVKASIAATTNYEAATATSDFTIAKATLEASVTLDGWTYGETAATPSVTGNTEDGAVTFMYKVKDAADDTYTETQPSNAGTYTVKASIAATTNYEAATTTTDFTIAQKSLGDGVAPAPGIIVNVTKTGDNYTVSVKDNGSDLSTDDYDVMEPGAEDNPMIWTITGKRNYKGGAVVTHETITFWKTEETATGMQDVATYISKDVNKVTPSGMTAYIVTGINMTKHALKLKRISDIPQNVPVLLLTSLTETDEENEIDFTASPTAGSTSDTDGNQLQVSTGQEVEAGQVYAFYKGKFALTTKGTLKVDKFFLDNPTYTVATPGTPISAAPLRIVFDETTDVEDGIWKMDDGRDDKWYSLDGRRLNGRPIKKGLYIRNGHKVVIK